jgi:Putative zinc-finger
MRCSEASHQLQLYIDHRLTLEQTRLLEAHVTSCTVCRAELVLLEEIVGSIHQLKLVAEPADLTVQIMRRVAQSPRSSVPQYSLLRPSLPELLTVIVLATIATLGSILAQPSVRALLPFVNGKDMLSQVFLHCLKMLVTMDSGTLMLTLWIVGTILGVCITLVLAGDEVRGQWYRAMMERLPVR